MLVLTKWKIDIVQKKLHFKVNILREAKEKSSYCIDENLTFKYLCLGPLFLYLNGKDAFAEFLLPIF